MKIKVFILQLKSCFSKTIYAKFERVCLYIIHHFINVICYSWVDDARDTYFACYPKPKHL